MWPLERVGMQLWDAKKVTGTVFAIAFVFIRSAFGPFILSQLLLSGRTLFRIRSLR